MFDLIQLIVNKVVPSIPWSDMTTRRDRRRVAQFGAKLFLFYVALNRICTNGEAILGEARWAVEYAEVKKHEVIIGNLYYRVAVQGFAVMDLAASAYDLAVLFELIAPDAYRTIAPLIDGKASALQELAVALTGGYTCWSGLDRPKLRSSAEHRRPSPKLTDAYRAELQRELDQTYDLMLTLRGQEGVLSALQIDRLVRFLATEESDVRLEQLREAATNLREKIVGHFSVDDLLLQVGDPALVSGQPFEILGFRHPDPFSADF